jgi:hypothetical protein
LSSGFSHFFLNDFIQVYAKWISHTGSGCNDVFAVTIKETVGFQQPQKCGTKDMRRPAAVFRSPSPLLWAQHIPPCYATRDASKQNLAEKADASKLKT